MTFFVVKDPCIPQPPNQMTLPGGNTELRGEMALCRGLAYCPFLILVFMTDFFNPSLQAY